MGRTKCQQAPSLHMFLFHKKSRQIVSSEAEPKNVFPFEANLNKNGKGGKYWFMGGAIEWERNDLGDIEMCFTPTEDCSIAVLFALQHLLRLKDDTNPMYVTVIAGSARVDAKEDVQRIQDFLSNRITELESEKTTLTTDLSNCTAKKQEIESCWAVVELGFQHDPDPDPPLGFQHDPMLRVTPELKEVLNERLRKMLAKVIARSRNWFRRMWYATLIICKRREHLPS